MNIDKTRRSLPIPPIKEVVHLFLLLYVLEQVKDAIVERLGVGSGISAWEGARWAQSKANLYNRQWQ
jgi:hypothetical protein